MAKEQEHHYTCGATSDIGVEREAQEDFVQFKELDKDNLLCLIADGTGSRNQHLQPASIVVMDIIENITEMYDEEPDLFLENPQYFLYKAFLNANRILGAFKMGNEEFYSGYASSVTACLFSNNNQLHVVHTGNTRMYIIRGGKMVQMTHDHTKAQELLDDGKIDLETYHVHPDRLKMTSGLGVVLDPEIQRFSTRMKENDIVVLTSDGVHYAMKPDAMTEIILQSADCPNAATNLVDAAKTIVKYPDNMSAMVVVRNKGQRW
jgi:serine/threonine protein phosphatase PrpC